MLTLQDYFNTTYRTICNATGVCMSTLQLLIEYMQVQLHENYTTSSPEEGQIGLFNEKLFKVINQLRVYYNSIHGWSKVSILLVPEAQSSSAY